MATMTKGNAIRYYRKFSGAERYLVGFVYAKQLWIADVEELLPRWLIMKEPSAKHKEKLQVNLKAKHKAQLVKKGATPICSASDFNEMNKDLRNKGKTLERLVFEMNGREDWVADTVRFDKCGDININGVEYQVKFQNAQVVTVDTLHKIQKEKKVAKRG